MDVWVDWLTPLALQSGHLGHLRCLGHLPANSILLTHLEYLYLQQSKLARRACKLAVQQIIIVQNNITIPEMLPHPSPKHRGPSLNLKLSEAMGACSPSKSKLLRLENKKITHIDILHAEFNRDYEEVSLAHNLIKRLTNMSQFEAVRVVDVSHNLIEDCNQLLSLKGLECLETVRVKGNPFLNLEINLQVLQFLSSKQIDIPFKEKEQEMIMENSVLQNQLQLIFLQHTLQLIQIHTELASQSRMQGREDINVNYILKGYKKFKEYDRLTLSRYIQAIKLQAYQFKEENEVTLLDAYNQMESYQQSQKEELTNNIIVKFTQYNRTRSKRNEPSTPSRGSDRYKPRNSNRDRDSLSPLYNMQLGEDTIRIKITPSFRKLPLLQTQKKLFKSFENQNQYNERYYKNLPKLNPVYNLLYSPISSLKSTEKDSLIDNLSDDLKKMAISLYLKQEEGASKEQRLNEEIEYLKEMGANSRNQNQQLIEIISEKEKEIRDCELDKETIGRLETLIKNKDKELSRFRREAQEYKAKILELEDEVARYQQYHQIEQTIREKRQQSTKREMWMCILEKYWKIQRFKEVQKSRVQAESEALKLKVFEGWREVRDNGWGIQQLAKGRVSSQLHTFFHQLRHCKNISHRSHTLKDKLQRRTLLREFKCLMRGFSTGVIKRKLKERSEFHCRKQLLSRSFRSMKIQWIRYNSPCFKDATNQVTKHYEMRLKIRSLEGLILNKRLEIESRVREMERMNRESERQEEQRRALSKNLKSQSKKRKVVEFFELGWKESVRRQCVQRTQEFYIFDLNKLRRMKSVIYHLRQNSRRFIGHKVDRLADTLWQKRVKSGLKGLRDVLRVTVKHKRLVHRNILKSLIKKQYDAFHQWKMMIVHNKLDRAPRVNVEEYELRESHLVKITQLLKLEIETKDEETSLCHQKISELQFTITSQDIKYEQLRAIHEGSLLEMRRREAELLEAIMRMQGRKDYVAAREIPLQVSEIKDDLKKARIFNEGDRNSIYKKNF